MGRSAIYPGTFDPITNGHIDLIKRAAQVFDHVIVAVAEHTHKTPIFSHKERVEMVTEATKDIERVEIAPFSGLVVEFARSRDINVLIRGLRMISDFEYEFQMALTNRRLASDVETVFLMPSEKYSYLSSTLMREVAALGADLSPFVPDFIGKRLTQRLRHEG